MLLYGSTTSPFVRRVRIVLEEIDVPYTFILVNTPETEALFRQRTPLWKMPVAEIEGKTIFDSHVIIDYLLAHHGHPKLLLAEGSLGEQNFRTVIDGALEAAIFLLYLKRDGVSLDEVPYCKKQAARVESALAWVEAELDSHDRLGGRDDAMTLSEIGLATTLDWMDFRGIYPTSKHPRFAPLRDRLSGRASFVKTVPHP